MLLLHVLSWRVSRSLNPSSDISEPIVHRKETQREVVWSCLPFTRSGQNHLARHSKRGKKTRQTDEEVGRQHQGMDRPGVCKVSEDSGVQGKMEETGCEIICDAPVTLAKGLRMMVNTIVEAGCEVICGAPMTLVVKG